MLREKEWYKQGVPLKSAVSLSDESSDQTLQEDRNIYDRLLDRIKLSTAWGGDCVKMTVGMRTPRRLRTQVKNDKDAVEVIYWCTLRADREKVEAKKVRIRRWMSTAFLPM